MILKFCHVVTIKGSVYICLYYPVFTMHYVTCALIILTRDSAVPGNIFTSSQHGIAANLSSEDSTPHIIDSTVNNYRKRNWPWAGLGHATSGDANICASPSQEAVP